MFCVVTTLLALLVSHSPAVESSTQDNERPEITVNAPAISSNVSNEVSIIGTASDSVLVAHIELSIYNLAEQKWWNGAGWQTDYHRTTANGTSEWVYDIQLPTGTFWVEAYAYDTSDNQSYADQTWFNVSDNTAPSVTLTTPILQSPASSIVAITGTALDNIEVSHVELTILDMNKNMFWNGTDWQTDYTRVRADNTNNWNYHFHASTGTYWIGAYAFDNYNNSSSLEHSWFRVLDNTPPTVTMTLAASGNNNNSTLNLIGTAADNASVNRVELAIKNIDNDQLWNGTSWQYEYTRVVANGTDNWEYSFQPHTGTYWVAAYAFDSSNNTSTLTTTWFRITDDIAPTVSITSPTPASTVNTKIEIEGTSNDNISISHIELAIMNINSGQLWNGTIWQSEYTRVEANNSDNWDYELYAPPGTYWIGAYAFDTSNKGSDLDDTWLSVVETTIDFDSDGIPDNSELLFNGDPNNSDTDADGVNDGQELIDGTQIDNSDSDNDGLIDSEEKIETTNPLSYDTDLDGLSDKEEQLYGTDGNLSDTDGDGVNDGLEVLNGTDPLDSTQWKKPFYFAAVGDFGSEVATSRLLESVYDGTDFTLALGDLGYDGAGNEQAWCDYVKSFLPSDYPFELLIGNHEEAPAYISDTVSDWTVYRDCFPSRIPNSIGDYGVQGYFDYNDLARFIQISPSINLYGASYEKGSPEYQWVGDVIDDARENHIDWIFLSTHENCLVIEDIYISTCSIGQDIYNLAHAKGVDIILQGHDHNYSRTKHLAHSPTCTTIIPNSYNAGCVAESGDLLTKGSGTTTVISGLGGLSVFSFDPNDAEIGYFETFSAGAGTVASGYTELLVSQQSVTGSFIPTLGTGYTDNFSVVNNQVGGDEPAIARVVKEYSSVGSNNDMLNPDHLAQSGETYQSLACADISVDISTPTNSISVIPKGYEYQTWLRPNEAPATFSINTSNKTDISFSIKYLNSPANEKVISDFIPEPTSVEVHSNHTWSNFELKNIGSALRNDATTFHYTDVESIEFKVSATNSTDSNWNPTTLMAVRLHCADTDGDGAFDEFEIKNGTSPTNKDTDGDGISDLHEILGHSPSDALDSCDPNNLRPECDFDGDGLSNEQESSIGTDPKLSDTDGDTLTDGFEFANASSPIDTCSPYKLHGTCDYDGDGYSNGEEILLGTDPRIPSQ